MLYDDRGMWDVEVGGRLDREGVYVSLWLIGILLQKPTQHYKVTIFQFKKF